MSLAASQRAFAAHLRDPDGIPAPSDIEDRRLQIYRELVFNNVRGFIDSGFPVLRGLLDADDYHRLVRDFLVEHRAHSPYFLEISQEFLAFLEARDGRYAFLPPFAIELARYEWVELALDVAEAELPADRLGRPLDGGIVLSPLAWLLACQYPVHRIGPDYRPEEPLPSPVFLVVYRNREDAVKFLEVNAVTARLLEMLQQAGSPPTVDGVLAALATEAPQLDARQLVAGGREALERLRQLDIVYAAAP
jgi:hypothetical protein